MRVPRPMICLNSATDAIRRSSTMSLHVWASTPVVISREVVAITGKVDSGSMKLSSCAFPSSLSPVAVSRHRLTSWHRSGWASLHDYHSCQRQRWQCRIEDGRGDGSSRSGKLNQSSERSCPLGFQLGCLHGVASRTTLKSQFSFPNESEHFSHKQSGHSSTVHF